MNIYDTYIYMCVLSFFCCVSLNIIFVLIIRKWFTGYFSRFFRRKSYYTYLLLILFMYNICFHFYFLFHVKRLFNILALGFFSFFFALCTRWIPNFNIKCMGQKKKTKRKFYLFILFSVLHQATGRRLIFFYKLCHAYNRNLYPFSRAV